MYQSYYKLQDSPFRIEPDPRFFFESYTHKRALTYLHYGFRQSEGFAVITGEPGCGKTELLLRFADELPRNHEIFVKILTVEKHNNDILKSIAASFLIPPDNFTKGILFKKLEEFFVSQARRDKRILLFIDDAHLLSNTSLDDLSLLSDIQYGIKSVLQCFLFGEEILHSHLCDPAMASLKQRVVTSAQVNSLEKREVQQYIEYRLQQAGWQGDPGFDETVYPLIYDATYGIPRHINHFCNRLLLHSYLSESHQISREDIYQVVEQLSHEAEGQTQHYKLPPIKPLQETSFASEATGKLYHAQIPRSIRHATAQTDVGNTQVLNQSQSLEKKIAATAALFVKLPRIIIDTKKSKLSIDWRQMLIAGVAFLAIVYVLQLWLVVEPRYVMNLDPQLDIATSSVNDNQSQQVRNSTITEVPLEPPTSNAVTQMVTQQETGTKMPLSTLPNLLTETEALQQETPLTTVGKVDKNNMQSKNIFPESNFAAFNESLSSTYQDEQLQEEAALLYSSSNSKSLPESDKNRVTSTRQAQVKTTIDTKPKENALITVPKLAQQAQSSSTTGAASTTGAVTQQKSAAEVVENKSARDRSLSLPAAVKTEPQNIVVESVALLDQPHKATNTIADEVELNALLMTLTSAYDAGDLERFVRVFAQDAQSNESTDRSAIEEDYRKLFTLTDSRKMIISDIEWIEKQNHYQGQGNFTLFVREKGAGAISNYGGTVSFQIEKSNNGLLFTQLDYDYKD